MSTDRNDQFFTTAEAIAFVKKVDREASGSFCLRVRHDAMIPGTDGYFDGALSTYLRISRKDALHIVASMLSHTIEERGGRIRITNYPGPEAPGKTTYWIG